MNNLFKAMAVLALGAAIGVAGYAVLQKTWQQRFTGSDNNKREPLYWVAPMDSSYKRDEPGKSPMGMDLVPVYEESSETSDEAPGTVRISPAVVNNLGVRTASVKEDFLHTEINTVGYVQYDEDRLVHIHSRVEGWVEKLYVKAAGDPVGKGMPLYEIYSPTLVNAQEELLLAQKRNNDRLIRAAEKRLRYLQVPTSTIEKIKTSGNIRQTVTVYSPQAGVVKKLNIRDGFYVNPEMTIISIGVLDQVWVVGEIFERQVSMVEEGDKVSMTLDYLPGRSWTGEIDYIYPTLNTETRTAQVRMRFANPDRSLKPGMFVRLEIMPEQGDQKSILIPREALIRTGDQNRVVLALGDGRFRSVMVKVGRISERQVEILDGLQPGDRIVTSAQFLIDSESSKSAELGRMEQSGQHAGGHAH